MSMERWDPFGEMSRFREIFDRMVGENWPRYWRTSQIGSNVPMDICDMEDELLVRAAVPGCRPEDLDITVKEDILTIRGEMRAPDYIRWGTMPGGVVQPTTSGQEMTGQQTQQSQAQPQSQPTQQQQQVSRGRARAQAECWLQEMQYGRFARSVTLPVSVNAANARAEFLNGVLILHIPKAEETKPRRIEVKPGAQELQPGQR